MLQVDWFRVTPETTEMRKNLGEKERGGDTDVNGEQDGETRDKDACMYTEVATDSCTDGHGPGSTHTQPRANTHTRAERGRT